MKCSKTFCDEESSTDNRERRCDSADMYHLWERRFLVFIRQGRGTLIGIYTVILALYGHVDNIAMNILPCHY